MLIVKGPQERHEASTKRWADGSHSFRRVLSGLDGVPFVVTEFHAKAGCDFADVHYQDDELVYVMSGCIRVTPHGGEAAELGANALYIATASQHFRFEALEDSILICSHSRAEGGPVPNDG